MLKCKNYDIEKEKQVVSILYAQDLVHVVNFTAYDG